MLLPAEEPHLRERGLDQMLLQPRGAALPTPDTGLPSQQTGTVAVCGSGCPVRGALSWLPFPRQVCQPSCLGSARLWAPPAAPAGSGGG